MNAQCLQQMKLNKSLRLPRRPHPVIRAHVTGRKEGGVRHKGAHVLRIVDTGVQLKSSVRELEECAEAKFGQMR